jgi:hypothetical protein
VGYGYYGRPYYAGGYYDPYYSPDPYYEYPYGRRPYRPYVLGKQGQLSVGGRHHGSDGPFRLEDFVVRPTREGEGAYAKEEEEYSYPVGPHQKRSGGGGGGGGGGEKKEKKSGKRKPMKVSVWKPNRLGGSKSRTNHPYPPYLNPRKKNKFSNPDLWWYGGNNLYRYRPVPGSYGALPLRGTLALPRPWIARPGADVIVYAGTVGDFRCEAADPATGIRCIYSASPNDICPGCGESHYCSLVHAKFAGETAVFRKYGNLGEKVEASTYYYCPKIDALWVTG